MLAVTIACNDYIEGAVGPVPKRLYRTNPDALENRWGNFVYAMDLSPEPDDDELGNVGGAWSLWDLPVTHAAQIDDDRGDDMIVVAIMDRVYVLDWTRYRDEWDWNAFKQIYRMIRFGPIPHVRGIVDDDSRRDANLELSHIKRFREFYFALKQPPTANNTAYRLSVGEWDNEAAATRTTVDTMTERNRANISLQGQAFVVTLEHVADEPFSPYQWRAEWDDMKRPVRVNRSRKRL